VSELESNVLGAFRQRFGGEPEIMAVAPGRVNLIGEHTDYNEGFVFPAAIDRNVVVAARRSKGPSSHLISLDRKGEGKQSVNCAKPGMALDRRWWDYPVGMAWALRQATSCDVDEIDAVVQSSVPIGSGLSSSAAIEMAFAVLWNELGGCGATASELARAGQVCENQFIGVNSGIMDQMASALGQANRAMFIDTRSLELEYAPIPAGLSVVVLDTKKPRALATSAYNERRKQCEEGAAALGVASLRDATVDMLNKTAMDEVVHRRCRHVITENERCVAFRDALDAGEIEELGRLMRASHVSLRDDYEVSCVELDTFVEAAWGRPECVGARMTGAGFGGCCVALVQTESVAAFNRAVMEIYQQATGWSGASMVCQVADGARRLH
jgi:galactokinase